MFGAAGVRSGAKGPVGGVRVDVNEELKLLCECKKRRGRSGSGRGGGVGQGWVEGGGRGERVGW